MGQRYFKIKGTQGYQWEWGGTMMVTISGNGEFRKSEYVDVQHLFRDQTRVVECDSLGKSLPTKVKAIDDGGPAFPATPPMASCEPEITVPPVCGMSLREYFAAQSTPVAYQILVPSRARVMGSSGVQSSEVLETAKIAVEIADALIAALKAGGK